MLQKVMMMDVDYHYLLDFQPFEYVTSSSVAFLIWMVLAVQ
jgi:hypothetical protein